VYIVEAFEIPAGIISAVPREFIMKRATWKIISGWSDVKGSVV
jgi:hypothetical protein